MTAIATLLVDSYRLLKAQALFWITLGITLLFAVIYLSIGFNEQGMTMLFGLFQVEDPELRKGTAMSELIYVGIYTQFIVPVWMTWIAVVLGLISTASIFPDFMKEGSIDLALSKPVKRLTVFLWKYIGSLLFMLIQVGLFSLLVFVALRWRVGTWNPSVLWTIPLAVLTFSYLYAVVVLMNIATRSALPAILVALLVWFLSFLVTRVEGEIYAYLQDDRSEQSEFREVFEKLHKPLVYAGGLLPKTRQTMEFSNRLITIRGRQFSAEDFAGLVFGSLVSPEDLEGVDEIVNRNSGWYIIGSSLLFEVVLVGAAAWVFCRRDF